MARTFKCALLLAVILLSSPLSPYAHGADSQFQEAQEGGSTMMAVGGGCVLGAAIGTVVFPGIGTAAGCAIFSLGSWSWLKLAH